MKAFASLLVALARIGAPVGAFDHRLLGREGADIVLDRYWARASIAEHTSSGVPVHRREWLRRESGR
jgi:hypothetical protein